MFAPFGLLEPREFALFGPRWHRLEALTQLGALNERCLGYAMRPSGVDPARWCQSGLTVSVVLSSVGWVASARPSKPMLRHESPPPALSAPPAQDGLEASLELGGEIVAVLKEILDQWMQCLRVLRT